MKYTGYDLVTQFMNRPADVIQSFVSIEINGEQVYKQRIYVHSIDHTMPSDVPQIMELSAIATAAPVVNKVLESEPEGRKFSREFQHMASK